MSIIDDLIILQKQSTNSNERQIINGMLTISDEVMQVYIYKFGLNKDLMNNPILERDEILIGLEL